MKWANIEYILESSNAKTKRGKKEYIINYIKMAINEVDVNGNEEYLVCFAPHDIIEIFEWIESR